MVVVLVVVALGVVVVVVGRGRVVVVLMLVLVDGDEVLVSAGAVVLVVVSMMSRVGGVRTVERERGPSATTRTPPWWWSARVKIAPTTARPTAPAMIRVRTWEWRFAFGSSGAAEPRSWS